MQENFFKRNPQDGAVGRLKQRAKVNREGPRFLSATRQPAWAKVVATGGSCGKTHKFSISSGSDKFNERHNSKFKHEPTLDKINLIYGGDYGMNIELEIQITAHNREDFNQIEKALLVPGSKITLSFGYTSNIDPSVQGGYLPSKTEEGFRTVSFAFSTTANGAYVCTCKASAPAQWIKTIETKVSLPTGVGGQYIITGWAGGTSKADVVGIPELLAYDAQAHGDTSIDDWDEGKTITEGEGHIVVYAGNTVDQNNWFNKTVKYFTTYGDEADSENTRNKVYYTLGYVIDRIVNQVVIKNAKQSASKKDKVDIDKLKIVLPPNQYSEIPHHISSGDPTRILFLGEGFAKFRAKGEETVDFYELAENKSAVRAAKYGDEASQITHSKILIAKSILEEALKDSTAEKMEEQDSDNQSVKGTDSKEINLEQFLNNIFSHIKEVCGGAINLGLTVDPKDKLKNTLRVVDRNYGRSEPLEIIVLNPIDSDGVTRECSIKSNVGSQQYQAYMFTGGSGEKDAVTHLRKCDGSNKDAATDERKELYNKAVTDIEELAGLKDGKGTLLKSGFASAQSESLIAAFKVIYNNVDVVDGDHKRKFRMMPYMGMELSATLDGIWGLVPGNGLFTTQIPYKYHQNGAYFNIRSVEHTIENSDWSTSVSGILTYHPKNELNLIKL